MNTLHSLLDLTSSHAEIGSLCDTSKIICHHSNKLIDKHYSWEEFCSQRAAWQKTFSEHPGQRFALFSHSSFEFICALSALWQCQKIAVIPGNNDEKNCLLLQQHCDAFAGDFDQSESLEAADKDTSNTPPCITEKPLSSAFAVVIFTSGSSGAPLPIHKTFAQLDAEINSLENLWGNALGDCTVTGTVTHQHIYGLLFRVLWPILSGRPFVDQAHDYSESLLNDCQHYGDIAAIMSPAHLSRLPQAINTPLVHQHCKAVFSSGAPLVAKAAEECREIFLRNIIEVYGSSETGGVAHRQQLDNPLWQLLPGVNVKSQTTDDGTVLCIKSPHLDNAGWFVSADQVETLSPDGFALGKRVDRIAKIGGKRISLTDIENKIQQHPWVAQVRVITLDQHGGRSAALVVLNSEGNNQLINTGKRQINVELNRSLESQVERIALPRYWRYWDSIPCNPQGKTTHAELASFFDDNKPQHPLVLHTNDSENSRELTLFMRHNISWFDGHFPGRPILPGVVQTHWANYYAEQAFGKLGTFSHLEMIKFQHVITPGKQLQLQLKWNPEKRKLTFSYQQGTQKYSSGRIAFNPSDTEVL